MSALLGGGTQGRLRRDAVAQALQAAGARVCAFVPGYGGTEVFEALRALPAPAVAHGMSPLVMSPLVMSLHEEVAYGVCMGASLGGARAACLMKAHGLAKAANAVVASLSAGVGAGLVALVFDDEAGQHSDNILSARRLCEGLELPWRHVGEGVSAYDDVRRGFEVSEALGLPVALIMPSHQMASPDAPTRGAGWGPAPGLRPVARDVARRLVCPPLSGYQRRVFEAKRRRLDPDAVPRPTLPRVPDDLPPRLRATATRYAPFFDAFCAVRGDDAVVTGDAGTSALFGLPPYGCVDWCAYMGGSVPMGVGASAARGGEVWALSGDFSFVSAAHLGLLEAAARGVPLKVVVFADGAASATGGQPVPRALLDAVLAAYRPYVREVARPEDPGSVRAALLAMARCDTLCVLVLDYRSEHRP